MKKTASKKRKTTGRKSRAEWQIEEYDKQDKFNFAPPQPFLCLCKLMDITPYEVVLDFMDNLSCGSWKREGRDEIKTILIEYFIKHGYGQQHYTEEEIREIFREMDAVGLLFPENDHTGLIDLYSEWRDKNDIYWFNKWYSKPRRKTVTK
ncbi:hypothetical protein [Compostibacter hankyongensis]|uniref:DUF1376 domain-containing protein n=1 Tax=Compostibacter hankyongensis TaxID=1007089 RepID=A0ABP8FCY5_9BACT